MTTDEQLKDEMRRERDFDDEFHGRHPEDEEMTKLKCECPSKGNVNPKNEGWYSEKEWSGMNHKPNECKGTNNIKQYMRDGKKLWLCSCCCLPGDEEIK